MSRRRPASTTFQPASSSACALARPMPLPAPVMTAIFSDVAMPHPPFQVLSQCRPGALSPGAVPEQPFVLRRAAEGGQHAGPDARCRRRGGPIGDADDPADCLAEMRIGIGVD